MKESINWWNIINKIDHDSSTWDYLEPAEIIELLERIIEAKEKIKGLDNYISLKLSPPLQKLKTVANPFNKYEITYNYIAYKKRIKFKAKQLKSRL